MTVVQYDAQDQEIQDQHQMLQYDGAMSSIPTKNITCYVQTSKGTTPSGHRYIRNGLQAPGGDVKTFDLAKFNVATMGCPTPLTPLGKLYVWYEVDLFQPVSQPYAERVDKCCYMQCLPYTANWMGTTEIDATDIFNTGFGHIWAGATSVQDAIDNIQELLDPISNCLVLPGMVVAAALPAFAVANAIYVVDKTMAGRTFLVQIYGAFTQPNYVPGAASGGPFAGPVGFSHTNPPYVSFVNQITDWINSDRAGQWTQQGSLQQGPTALAPANGFTSQAGWQTSGLISIPQIGDAWQGVVLTEDDFLDGKVYFRYGGCQGPSGETFDNWTVTIAVTEMNGEFV